MSDHERRWSPPPLGSAPPRPPTAAGLPAVCRDWPSPEAAARLREEAEARGYAEGLERGRREAQAQWQARIETLDALLAAFEAPFAELQESLREALLELLLAIARRILRRELEAGRRDLAAVIEAALAHLPADQPLRVQLAPQDLECIGETLREAFAGRAIEFVAAPPLRRGELRIEGGAMSVDLGLDAELEHLAEWFDRFTQEGEDAR
ncbi:MAG: hypothetical protein KatS3mg121_1438 [Gammaproteobacteria bacterium]|nr:MAG: hypothetical protein KatS3mg121_1438 [Gammaproteobacteria bacterium]